MNKTISAKSDISRQTYVCDLFRGGFDGVLHTGAQTFALFIAIRYFDANDAMKSLIAAAPFMGMFLSMLLVHYASLTGAKKSVCAAIPATVTGIGLLIASQMEGGGYFVFWVILAYICRSSLLPLMTSMYGDNYPPKLRGQYFSHALLLSVGVSVTFSYAASLLLDLKLTYFNWIFIVLGICGLGKAKAIYSMPSQPVEPSDYSHPLGNMKHIFKDRFFGYVLLTWFIMGFANLWVLPLRVDYVTSSTYGIEGSAAFVALITAIIPDAMRFLFIPVWGRLFDRMNFVVLRMTLNTLFGLGIALFFLTTDPIVISAGSALIGISFAGGSIAWSLWVTKYAPPGKSAAYMSVHTALTGIRGTLGPIIGFWAVKQIGPVNIGWISFAMMLLATVMLIPEIKHGRLNAHH